MGLSSTPIQKSIAGKIPSVCDETDRKRESPANNIAYTQALLLGTDVLLNCVVKARGIGVRPNPQSHVQTTRLGLNDSLISGSFGHF